MSLSACVDGLTLQDLTPCRTKEDRFSGNGGLSIRRVSAIKRVLSFQERYNDTEAEDEWFGKRIYILPGAKVASGADGALTVEDVYIDNSMGFHVRDGGNELADDVWKDPAQRKKIFSYCPELTMIMEMKLERERCDGDDKKGAIHPTPEEKEATRLKEEQSRKKLEAERKKKLEADRKKAEEEEKKAKEEEEEEKKSDGDGDESPTSASIANGEGYTTRSAEGYTTWSAEGYTTWSAEGYTTRIAEGYTTRIAEGYTTWSAEGPSATEWE